MLTVGKDGSVIEKLKEILVKYLEGASPKYYPPVENLLDLIYEHYTENNSIAPQTTEAGKEAKQKEKNLETSAILSKRLITWRSDLPRYS